MEPVLPSPDSIQTYGYCNTCGTLHTLPVGGAVKHCLDLMDQLEKEKRIDLSVPASEADPKFSTDLLWGWERGQMFGVLVCEDDQGNEVILKAFSCQHGGEWSCDGWADPLVDPVHYLKRTGEVGDVITDMTKELKQLKPGTKEHRTLKAERKALSQNFMKELHGLYHLHNFKGEEADLETAFYLNKGIPTGSGDCCAPKLLNEAAQRGLRPTGLAEFFWGKETSSGTRFHRHFYPSCEDKCQPILGFLLCGACHE